MATRKDIGGLAPTIASPVAATPKSKQLNRCACGCGRETGKTWYPGDDAVHKGRLLERLDSGDADAGVELVNRGWYTEARLERRALKQSERAVVKAEKAAAKAAATGRPKARTVKAKGGAQAPARDLDELVEGGVAAAVAAIGGGDAAV